MKKQVSHISVHQSSKVMAALLIVIMTIFAIIPAGLYALANGETSTGLFFLIVGPIVYGILFYIFHAITYWLYNFVARHLGGVEFELKDAVEEPIYRKSDQL